MMNTVARSPEPVEFPHQHGCIVQFAGGHSSLLRNTSIEDIREEIVRAREEGLELVYLQPGDRPANSVVVDPRQVVALVVKH